MIGIVTRIDGKGRPLWLLNPGQLFIVPVQYRPALTVHVPQREAPGGPVTGQIKVTPDGKVAMSGHAREWILSAHDLIGERQ